MAKPKGSSPNGDAESSSFENSFTRLAEMAEQLEAGGLTLADATARFAAACITLSHSTRQRTSAFSLDSTWTQTGNT